MYKFSDWEIKMIDGYICSDNHGFVEEVTFEKEEDALRYASNVLHKYILEGATDIEQLRTSTIIRVRIKLKVDEYLHDLSVLKQKDLA